MKHHELIWFWLFLISLIILALIACAPPSLAPTLSPTPDIEAIVAARVKAELTAIAPTATATLLPTATALPPTPTATAVPASPTPVPPTSTPTPYVIKEYPERRADGSVWVVRQWSTGRYEDVRQASPAVSAVIPTAVTRIPSCTIVDQRFAVAANYQRWFDLPLQQGERISGYFEVEAGYDINFSIQDGYGNVIRQGGRVSGIRSFDFRADVPGTYRLVFENFFSTYTNKLIYLAYSCSFL